MLIENWKTTEAAAVEKGRSRRGMALSSSTAAAALRQPQFASSIAAPVKKTLQQKRFYTIPNFTSVWNHYQYIHGRSNEGGGGQRGNMPPGGLLGVLTSFPEKFRRTLLVYIKSKLFRLTYNLSWYFDGIVVKIS